MFKIIYIFTLLTHTSTLLITKISRADAYQTISVGSYNIKNQEQNLELLSDFNKLKHLDILALQEVQIESLSETIFLNPLLNQLEKTWKYQCTKPVNPTSNNQWEAQAILSKFPIEDCGVISLDHSGDKQRLAIWAKIILTNNQPSLFINTDHETDGLLTLGFPDRKKQLQSLVEAVSNCFSWLAEDCDQWPTVITGDFNTSEISIFSSIETVNEIQQTMIFLKAIGLEQIPACTNHKSTFLSFWGEYELDHIFVKNIQFNCRFSIKDRLGSDHLPIWSNIQLSNP